MPVIRTPDERFENLHDFPYEPKYIDIGGLRVHYVDEGEGDIILCLHGEPTWAYLYRKMIPILTKAGHRVITPDFIGFGRSDKYTEMSEYSFHMFYNSLLSFIEKLNLTRITLVVHDWGGLIGLPIAANNPDRFSRLVILNTFLPTGEEKPSEAFKMWRAFAETKEIIASLTVQNGSVTGADLSQEVLDAYDAPFPDKRYKAGMQVFPLLVPLSPDDPGAAEMKKAREIFKQWTKPVQILFSDSDPVLGNSVYFFRKLLPTSADQPEINIKNAGHFLQEDNGESIAQHIVEFLARTSE
ncbi:MAG: haloalkane dehalogenase [Candidatus Hodarchaeales archaeon]|jgi:haloalkane dehalogenase